MGGENGDNQDNGSRGNGLPILRIARPSIRPSEAGTETTSAGTQTETSSAETVRPARATTATKAPVRPASEPAPKTTRITKRDKAVSAAKNIVMTMDVGATLAAGPTAAMQKDERTLIETGMVSLANRYPDRFVSGGDALGPGMLAVGCLLWIRRIIKDRRNVAETSASLPPNPLAENWQPQQQSEQPEWVPADIPAIFTEQPQPNGALYEGAGDYDWVRQYTTIT